MTQLGFGIFWFDKLFCPTRVATRNVLYRIFILFFTFIIYTSYHLSRKPISVVKNVLHQNCSNSSLLNNITDCSWAPFDGGNYNTLLGSLDSAFLFAYAFAMFFSGHVAERLNLRYYLFVGMLMTGFTTSLFGFGYVWMIHSIYYYVFVQILSGIFQATGWPSVVTCVANWYGKGKRGFIMGVWNSHTSVGNILGSLIAGAFVQTNWALSFIVPGIIIAALGLIVFLFLVPTPDDVSCDPPNHADGKSSPFSQAHSGNRKSYSIQADMNSDSSTDEEEITDIIQEQDPLMSATDISNKPSEKPISFLSALKIPGVIEFSLCLFFSKLVSYTFLYWLPKYIDATTAASPNSARNSADLSTIFDAGGIIGGILAGIISDFSNMRAVTCNIMLFFAVPMLFFYQEYGSVSLVAQISLLLVTGAFVNGPYALITTAVSADLGTHSSLRGNSKALATVTAIIDGTGSMGAALGPLLAGLINPNSVRSKWVNVFYMLIGAEIAAFLLLTRLVYREVKRWRMSR